MKKIISILSVVSALALSLSAFAQSPLEIVNTPWSAIYKMSGKTTTTQEGAKPAKQRESGYLMLWISVGSALDTGRAEPGSVIEFIKNKDKSYTPKVTPLTIDITKNMSATPSWIGSSYVEGVTESLTCSKFKYMYVKHCTILGSSIPVGHESVPRKMYGSSSTNVSGGTQATESKYAIDLKATQYVNCDQTDVFHPAYPTTLGAATLRFEEYLNSKGYSLNDNERQDTPRLANR